MRIAHATDIHWYSPPSLADLGSFKRLLGTANLILRGRRKEFDRTVQRALVDHLVGLAPDLVLLTGDFSATALDAEFQLAREDLQPLLDRFPTFVIPGNHDVYTGAAQRDRTFEAVFSPWMGEPGPVRRLDVGDVTVLGLDPNRATWIVASGEIPEAQLVGLERALAQPELAARRVVLALHYPILDRRGEKLYDNDHHGLVNADRLVEILRAAPVTPALIVHGHVHHGFRAELRLGDRAVPIVNCGSSGHAWQPERGRGAATNLYTMASDGSVAIERFLHDGERFTPEPGGPYASGR